MVAQERLQIIIELLNKSTKELEKLKNDLGDVEGGMGEADESSRELSGSMKTLKKIAGAIGFAALANQARKFAQESILVAARVETLGVVTAQLGKNVGMTESEVRDLEKAIQEQGITTQASRQAVAQMVQAEIDLANSTEIARLAQDAAVIANTDSSDAFQKLVTVISTGRSVLAKSLGIIVDFEGAYSAYAASVGKSTQELTEQEKVQIRANEVLEQGAQITGTYEAAMETAGKQLGSFSRHWEELQVEVGKLFQDQFKSGIKIATELTDAFREQLEVLNEYRDLQEDVGVELRSGEISVEEYKDEMRDLWQEEHARTALLRGPYGDAVRETYDALAEGKDLTEEQTQAVYNMGKSELSLMELKEEGTKASFLAAGAERILTGALDDLGVAADVAGSEMEGLTDSTDRAAKEMEDLAEPLKGLPKDLQLSVDALRSDWIPAWADAYNGPAAVLRTLELMQARMEAIARMRFAPKEIPINITGNGAELMLAGKLAAPGQGFTVPSSFDDRLADKLMGRFGELQ